MPTQKILVYVTTPTMEEASCLAGELVSSRLVASANIIPGMKSIFWWNGSTHNTEEVVLLAKTRKVLFEAVKDKIISMHSYQCPCIISFNIDEGYEPFISWIEEETIDHC